MTVKDYISIINEIITALAVATGAVVAVIGLTAWKKQLKGTAEHDAARKFYRAVLQLRDAISYVRNPWIPIAETTAAEEQFKKENPDQELKNSTAMVYKIRWNKIVEALTTLQLESLEAEVFWEDEVKKVQKPIRQCVGKLNATLSRFLNPDMRSKENDDMMIYEVNTDTEKDEFTKEIEQAIEVVAKFVKPKIKFE